MRRWFPMMRRRNLVSLLINQQTLEQYRKDLRTQAATGNFSRCKVLEEGCRT